MRRKEESSGIVWRVQQLVVALCGLVERSVVVGECMEAKLRMVLYGCREKKQEIFAPPTEGLFAEEAKLNAE